MTYTGRFAPSPTGPLHMGSLVTAVASYCQAKSQQGRWLLRIEDLDPPREVAGATNDIIHTLEACGFEWDGEITYQSQRAPLYKQVLKQLELSGLSYPCGCSRNDIALTGTQTALGVRYPGTCRQGLPEDKPARSIRIKTTTEPISFIDKIQGKTNLDLDKDTGDFVIRRADGQFSYQLAVVVDDALQNITEVVRGNDLLDLTTRQIYL
ncbi:MAG: tRNA glutamyl-Q(34) synthetase GluQRS, partial [Gammaproteobacteria bacterium]|nr:tRNA glutamyl-Q(34) synthetase GluQRS [Gammaproteobacteria bacterium]